MDLAGLMDTLFGSSPNPATNDKLLGGMSTESGPADAATGASRPNDQQSDSIWPDILRAGMNVAGSTVKSLTQPSGQASEDDSGTGALRKSPVGRLSDVKLSPSTVPDAASAASSLNSAGMGKMNSLQNSPLSWMNDLTNVNNPSAPPPPSQFQVGPDGSLYMQVAGKWTKLETQPQRQGGE